MSCRSSSPLRDALATRASGNTGQRRRGPAQLLHRLQASALPIELWDHAILPTRCNGYVPRQLDELIAAGNGFGPFGAIPKAAPNRLRSWSARRCRDC